MANFPQILPSDAHALNRISDGVVLASSATLSARQRRLFHQTGWAVMRRREVASVKLLTWELSDAGRAVLQEYNSRTLDRTF